jgi:hypothetical protein
MSTQSREQMGEQARAILLAEVLGDIQKIAQKLAEFDAKLTNLGTRLDAGARREWVTLLDTKMREFQHFQIPEIAAIKLQVHSETFLRGVMSEVKNLIAAEVKYQSSRQNMMWMGFMFTAGFLVALMLNKML